jgi:hypothetical protein
MSHATNGIAPQIKPCRYDKQNRPSLKTSSSDKNAWKYPANLLSDFSEQSVQRNTLFNQDDLRDTQRPKFPVGTVVVVYASSMHSQCCKHIMCVVVRVDRSIVSVCVMDSFPHKQVTLNVDFFHIHKATEAEIYQWNTLSKSNARDTDMDPTIQIKQDNTTP